MPYMNHNELMNEWDTIRVRNLDILGVPATRRGDNRRETEQRPVLWSGEENEPHNSQGVGPIINERAKKMRWGATRWC